MAKNGERNGIGVDRYGNPVIDPTPNVMALVEANAETNRALREADNKFTDRQHEHIKEVNDLRAKHTDLLRISDLAMLEKTRAVDVLAGAQSAAQLATAVQTLATTAGRDAETLRSQLTATAQAIAKQTADAAAAAAAQTDRMMTDVNSRIAELQKASYQGAGKQSVADPMIAELISEMRVLTKTGATGAGRSTGMRDVYAAIVILVTIIISAVAVIVSR